MRRLFAVAMLLSILLSLAPLDVCMSKGIAGTSLGTSEGKGGRSVVPAPGSIHERIAAIEEEMRRTQKNKATEGHLGLLKARLAKLRTQRDTVVAGVKGEVWQAPPQ
jgi:hypothetical protein